MKNIPMLKITALLTIATLFLLTGCGGDASEESHADHQDQAADHQPAGDTAVGGDVGNLAPDFDLKDLAGGTLQLSSLKGKAVIIDFWDTWCPPCRKALPSLEAISQDYASDLVVVGVAFGRDGEKKVRDYVQQNNLTFPMVLADKEFKVAKDFGGVQSIPTTFLVDRNGLIVKKWVGGHSREEYEKAVKELLGA